MSTQSTIRKILSRSKPSKLRTTEMTLNVDELVSTTSLPDRLIPMNGFNLNAKPFYPPGEKERIEKMKLAKIEEDKYYDHLERVWWQQNKKMFQDSINDPKCLKPITPMPVIQEVEVQSATSWVDIVKKI